MTTDARQIAEMLDSGGWWLRRAGQAGEETRPLQCYTQGGLIRELGRAIAAARTAAQLRGLRALNAEAIAALPPPVARPDHATDRRPRRGARNGAQPMTDWNTVAPKRAENAVKALGLFAKTAGRNYDVPPGPALDALDRIDAAVAGVYAAYDRRIGCGHDRPRAPGGPPAAAPTADATPAPIPVADADWAIVLAAVANLHYHRVGQLAAAVPEAQVAALVTHLVNRLAEMAEGKEGAS